jgi:ribosomal-protein-alanine N-acetyltransferase
MSAEISIRPAVVEDAAEVLEIERNCAEAPHWTEGVWAQILSQHTQYAPLYGTPFGGSRRMCFVAEPADEIGGFVVISILSGSGAGNGVAEMESVAVREDVRKRGVGRSLCLQAMFWAQTMGAASVQLEVRSASVAAMALYRSLGFVEQGRRSGYYTDPKDDAVMMELALTQKDA